jgi:glycosyltransferase involved in cell wall biosynthesis
MEKVSIYIPTYNAEKTIKESIESLYVQSVAFDEVIIINDFSNDKTGEILKTFPKIKIFNNNKNRGLGYCRNFAMDKVSNNIVASIDADVVLDKYWLEKILSSLYRNDVVMAGGNLKEKLINNKYNLWRAKYYKQNWGDKSIMNPSFLYGCNTIQYKSTWLKTDGYDDNLMTNGEDVDYCNRVRKLERCNTYYESEALCQHLQNDDLNSLSQRVWRYHSFGYRIKKPSFYRFLKLVAKQLKIFSKRLILDLLNFKFMFINLIILIKFIKFEFLNYIDNK